MRVLLIDDDPLSNFVASLTLSHFSDELEVQCCLSGHEGLEAIKHCEEQELPEMIFLDINMPEMNGWQFIENLRTLDLPHQLKITILTSSVYREDRLKAKEYEEVTGYLMKPLKMEELEHFRAKQLI